MPTCKNCHREIRHFDADVCPYCGEKNPIASDYRTKDMTQFVDPITGEYKLYKSKSRTLSAILCLFLGWSGAHSFYLGFVKRGVIEIVVSALFIAGLGSLLFFTGWIANALAFFIPFFLLIFIYAIISFRYFIVDNLKDAQGEFLR